MSEAPRGDRRKAQRATPDRRSQTRTPGKLKETLDRTFEMIRKLEKSKEKA